MSSEPEMPVEAALVGPTSENILGGCRHPVLCSLRMAGCPANSDQGPCHVKLKDTGEYQPNAAYRIGEGLPGLPSRGRAARLLEAVLDRR